MLQYEKQVYLKVIVIVIMIMPITTGPERRRTSTSGIVAAWPRSPSPEGATLAARRVQNPAQAGTGDVHNPHTPLPARHQAATTLYHDKNKIWW